MFHYSYFSGHGRDILAAALFASDPFELAPAEIVERVLVAGYMPAVDYPKAGRWDTIGTVTQVERGGQTFLVAVSRDAQEISLQEIRTDPYMSVEPFRTDPQLLTGLWESGARTPRRARVRRLRALVDNP